MSNLIRDAPLGQLIRLITRDKYLRYAEEEPDFQLPLPYVEALETLRQEKYPTTNALFPTNPSNESIDSCCKKAPDNESTSGCEAPQDRTVLHKDFQPASKTLDTPRVLPGGTILVDWYGPTDPDNPQNWSSKKKALAAGIIDLYTLTVYAGSAICTPSYEGIMERFGVSIQVVSLLLSMYVQAYGIGPMLWSPLSEIPSIGRNPPYIITFAVFTILIVPTALAENFPGLAVLRFLLGFFGSPCLATGGASMGDLYDFAKLPYALSLWAFAAVCGPATAPLISGFSVAAENWRWAFWEMLWMSGPIWILMFLLLPETSSPTILLRRARRLRAATGNPSFKSQSEIDQSKITVHDLVVESLWRPMQMMLLDPSVAFTAIYCALVYGIYYSFFECVPLVFGQMHGFNLGEQGLIYLSIHIEAAIAIAFYWIYICWWVEPTVRANNAGPPERRLIPALPASILMPVGLFIFAWIASPDIHWIAPTIGITIFISGIVAILQCIFLYLPLSYPQYAASLFAGNDYARSTLAAATIHFSQPLYDNLGVPRGVTLLAGLTVGCIAGVFVLWHYGDKLRERSRFAPT
ncbi:hypothetical protein M409DRAFT_51093 [Zasmidium cellare ATCC 36951]|uniref:Cercosporin MFS transporter CTB4 n=1 Tax=Zasmidium cellare ATCC 36951 TaxID=1080233 RepID=A0A6A6CY85_ZASCE|nr:uncharacterized protein M409DRAFT_51093 [Zasmidium cellare ATCC 36951]KAF2170842.1 hypothetical protein M409DRAFT_51093 [Zasmidium cellare ATCC 36951]